jgi:hypothetical protein
MHRESVVPRPQGRQWETPAAEEIRVSAEASAYTGTLEDHDWT